MSVKYVRTSLERCELGFVISDRRLGPIPPHCDFLAQSFGDSQFRTRPTQHIKRKFPSPRLYPCPPSPLFAMGAEQSTQMQMDTTRAVAAGATAYKNTHEGLPKTVQELTDEQLGELVASTMDFCTSHYGSIPTNPELIKMAQKALESLNIKGDLKDREKDITRIVDMMLEDVETA